MKYKTIFIENRILLLDLDKNNIKFGDKVLVNAKTYHNSICEYRYMPCPPPYVSNKDICNKIIASSPKIEGVLEFETLPLNEDDELKESAIKANNKRGIDKANGGLLIEFIEGYLQAKSETMFNLEDMKLAYQDGIENISGVDYFNEFIQSLNKPKEYEFIPKMEQVNNKTGSSYSAETIYKPEVINGKVQGEWRVK